VIELAQQASVKSTLGIVEPIPPRVFLSHTSELREYPRGRSFVTAAEQAIVRAGGIITDMAYFTARSEQPAVYCRQQVKQADIYVGVIGFRYGSPVMDEPGVSYTELEYEAAADCRLPRLIFLLDDEALLLFPASMRSDRRYKVRQAAFRSKVLKSGTCASVSSPDRLELLLYQSLVEMQRENRTGHVPRELPPDIAAFTGRSEELAELDQLLVADSKHGVHAVVISAVSGTAGVGKTALAVRWAHSAQGRFPDGQLYIDLCGYGPGRPMTASDALARFLRSLGTPGQDIPADVAERTARYRSLMAGRRMLVILDNARDAEVIRPLLPGSPGCAVVVTSRDSLPGLVARDGAHRLDLHLLAPDDSIALLRALIGNRVDTDRAAAETLAEQCTWLPLALRVAAELAAARPDARLSDLTAELANEQRRLDLLDAGGDPRAAVRAVFSWSYDHLEEQVARAFRLLGLHPRPDFDRYAAAALTGHVVQAADERLNILTQAHLIGSAMPGRFGMHDLLRAYAADLATRYDTESNRRDALTRLYDYYRYAAFQAASTLSPADRERLPRLVPPDSLVPPLTEPDAAAAWLDDQRAILVAVAAHAGVYGWPEHAVDLSAILFRYLDNGGYYAEAITVHSQARRAARQNGDKVAEARALSHLGLTNWQQGRSQQATEQLHQALTICQKSGDRLGEARALANLALVDWQQGRYHQAAERQQRVAAVFQESGEQVSQARALGNLGIISERLGMLQDADRHLRHALDLFSASNDRFGQATTLCNLGCVSIRLGQYQDAEKQLNQAMKLHQQNRDHHGESYALDNLGVVKARQGQYQQAATDLRQAIALFRKTGDQPGESAALNDLGEALLLSGDHGQAAREYTSALSLASQIRDQYQRARARDGLGCTHHAAGNLTEAADHWRAALALYTALATADADAVRTRLAALSSPASTNGPISE
jgi:tetratricopeptide (TPR) repeat protein